MTDQLLPVEGFCGTAGCLAGHVVLAQGFRVATTETTELGRHGHTLAHPDGRRLSAHDEDFGLGDNVAGFAAEHLGLNAAEARGLFHWNNDMDDLKHLVDLLCAQPDRPEWSRQRLREAMDRVLDADAVGLWEQAEWIIFPGDR